MNEIKGIGQIAAPIADTASSTVGSASTADGGFLNSLKDAIAKANEVQVEASQSVEQLMTGESQNVHETMIALQKADVSFQLMMQIRNKIVSAYEEIQRMPV
jgi:flagellar hook-basal body complex protein FliE